MKILETKSTRWISFYESTLRKRIVDLFSDTSWRYSLDIDLEYLEETEPDGSKTLYLCTAIFFRYSPYAILVWYDFLENPKSEYSRIFKLPKPIPGEGDPVYCQEQFCNMLEENSSVIKIDHTSFKLESCVRKLIQLNCVDEARNT